jgi:hypothetical protein
MAMSTLHRRSLVALGVKAALSVFALFVVNIILHECAHYIAALIFGVSISRFSWFDLAYFAPVLVSASEEYTLGMAIVSYAGGLFTGTLLLSIVLFKWNWFKQSSYRWFLGLYLVAFGSWQICQGILEGAFHQAYISNASNLLFSPAHYMGYAAAFLGMFVYWLLMPRFRELKT